MIRRLETAPASVNDVSPDALAAGHPSFEEDCRALEAEYSAHKRCLAALRLRESGERAVEPLCRALRDPSPSVRAAAAETLGHIGDSAVVPALHRALKETMVGGSRGRQHAWVAVVAIVTLILTGLMVLVLSGTELHMSEGAPQSAFTSFGIILLLAPFVFGGSMLWARRHNVARIAIAEALTRIATRTGAPELTASLADLQVMARGGWGQSMGAVLAAREAAETVRAAASTGAHPIPALSPDSLEKLPVPAEGGSSVAMQLPLAVNSGEDDGRE